VLRNPWIRDWSQVGNFFFTDVWSFTNNQSGSSNYYRPFHMLAHAVGYTISGLKPYGFHLINILLHCLNTLFVSFIAHRLTGNRAISIAGGLLFALHPVHAESVSWIAGITDPLCAVFYFGAVYIYLHDDRSEGVRSGFYCALLFICALLSKEMAFMLPLILVWLDVSLGKKLHWGRYAAMAASFGIYAAFRVHALTRFNVNQLPTGLNFHDRLLSSIVLIGEYLAKAFVPFNINAFHVFHPTVSVADYRFILSVLVLLSYALGAWIFRSDRKMLFLIGFIPLSLLPVLNINGVGENIFADRYLYIPSLASCLLIPMLAHKAAGSLFPNSEISVRNMVLGTAGVISIVFACLLYGNSSIYRNNLLLYSETVKRSPDSAIMAGSLGWRYFEAGKVKDAEYWLRRSVENWNRSYIKIPHNLGFISVAISSVYIRQGKPAEALEYLRKAYALNPRDLGILQNFASILIYARQYDLARQACERAILINPNSENSYNNLAYVFLQLNEPDRAIENAQKAIQIFPQYDDAYVNLARGYAAKGMARQAREAYAYAKHLNPALQPAIDQELRSIK
jgi:protein O-mannosyl-transferase